MKKKFLLMLSIISILACLFAISVSADVTKYDDFGARTTVQASDNDLVVFDDGFTCPSAYITKDQTVFH